MRTFLLFIILVVIKIETTQAQPYTQGTSGQLYWNWRPDIADSCYEFTFNYQVCAKTSFSLFGDKINLFYWNDCNYSKAWMNVDYSASTLDHECLHDTLYRVTSHYGIVDTVCGFDAPFDEGSVLNLFQISSPIRKTLIYRGLIYLPEKCRNWHFTIGLNGGGYGTLPRNIIFLNGSNSSFVNKKSNLDSFYYSDYDHNYHWNNISFGQYGCSFNNLDFPDNSSVRYLAPPLYTYQVQKKVEFNPAPFDPDHDQIVISVPDTIRSSHLLLIGGMPYANVTFEQTDILGNPYPDIFTNNLFFAPLPGASGSNPPKFNAQNNPFDTDSTFHLVDSTGKTTFTAQSTMEPVLFYSAKEYRDNVFVSETYCVNQFTILADGRQPSYMQIDTGTIQNAYFNNQGTLLSAPGLPISFEAFVKLPGGPTGDLIVTTTADTTLPGNGNCNVTGVHSDSVHLSFSWTPPANAQGLYNVFVFAKDSNCNAPYHHYRQVYTWSFYIDASLSPVQTAELISNNNVILYPNPANNELHIECAESGNLHYEVMNLLGDKVLEGINTLQSGKARFNIEALHSGVYFIKLVINGKQWIRKFEILK